MQSDGAGVTDRLLAEQIRYYDDRAREYEDCYYRRGPHDRGPEDNARFFAEAAKLEASIASLDASGSVLELACGTGLWTRFLAPRARRLLAVDASAATLELNRARYAGPNVEYVHADLFEWTPPAKERFDVIVLGFFLSHVPPDRFAELWDRLRAWLMPGGRVWFADDLAGPQRPYSGDTVADGPPFAHRRRLADGSAYTIVKMFYEPDGLTAALDAEGWDADVRPTGTEFFHATATPR